MGNERPMNRRRFFREGLRELLRPLANSIESLADAAQQLSDLEKPKHQPAWHQPPPEAFQQHWIRPPGALPGQSYLDACSRCGECVRACPAQAIQLDYSGVMGGGAPYIEPHMMPCVMCDSLACMTACPTGALIPVPREEIDIGTAVWDEWHCVRHHGEQCTTCVDKCPVGSAAIQLIEERIVVHQDGCTGCGVCEHECPTYPKSITVTPRDKREEEARIAREHEEEIAREAQLHSGEGHAEHEAPAPETPPPGSEPRGA